MTAWESADILPWDAWINRCWLTVAPTLSKPPVVLSDRQLESVWTNIIERDISRHATESEPLWSARATARTAVRTLTLIRQWNIDAGLINFSEHEDHRCFTRWLRTYEHICEEENWIEFPGLVNLLIEHTGNMDTAGLFLAGFDKLLPLQNALIHAFEQNGVEVTNLMLPEDVDPARGYIEFDDDLSQWLAAGQWIRQKLSAEPDCRVALVAPDLAKSKDNIEYALRQTLCPKDIIDIDDRATLPFHISLGASLGSQQIIKNALNLLTAFSQQNISIDLISELILSPHVFGADEERSERGMLDLKLRQHLPMLTNLKQVGRFLDSESDFLDKNFCPALRDLLATADQLLIQLPARGTFSSWSKYFDQLLSILGWPGSINLNSEDFQAVKSLREQFSRMAELDLTAATVSFDSAVNWLRQYLKTEIFQIEDTQPQVEVVGVMESAGLEFDCLWFGGLVEADWPPRLQIDPFIPISLQRQIGIESASASGMLDFARLQQKRLLGSAREVVISRHRFESDIAMEPSPLINFPTSCEKMSVAVPPKIDQILNRQRPTREFVEDDHGPAVSPDEVILGGTGLIQAQSRCPRGAYARYRLGAELAQDNQPGLDNFERGALVHKVLELVWHSLGSSKELQAIPSGKLEQLIAQCTDRASMRFRSSSGCGDQFFLSVQRWIVFTVHEWLELEKLRVQPFEVLALERSRDLELAGLDLHFKADRIDKLEDGSVILIDYKTGSGNNINDWQSDRPLSPQLPLYALTQSDPIEAIAWGQVRLGQCRFIGISNHNDFAWETANGAYVKKFDQHPDLVAQFGTWEGMLKHWTDTLNSIASEFLRGDASYDPANCGVCVSCPTPVICRNGDRFILDQT